jgi:hypothetical protein
MTTHLDPAEYFDKRIVTNWTLGEWADRLFENG